MTAPAALPTQYWAVHFQAIDQVVAMINYQTAIEWAESSNATWAAQSAEQNLNLGEMNAKVVTSPWAGEQHYLQCSLALSKFLKDGEFMISSMAAAVAQFKPDAERFAFARHATLNPVFQKALETEMAWLDGQAEPTTAAEYDGMIDRCLQVARTKGVWPPVEQPDAAAGVEQGAAA